MRLVGLCYGGSCGGAEVLKLFTSIEPALVGIEACHTGHYWAREIIGAWT